MKHPLHFERRHEPLASPTRFSSRLVSNGLWAAGTIVAVLAIGMAGYTGFEGMGFIDAFVNAAMILSGMGPLTPLHSDGGRFRQFLRHRLRAAHLQHRRPHPAPVYHRLLHRFHVDEKNRKD
jgi:hypothetical protein